GLPHVGVEPRLAGLALAAVVDDSVGGHPPLDSGEQQTEQLQQAALHLADLPPFMEEHGDVMEVAELRGPLHLLQPVEGEREEAILQNGVEQEGLALAQPGFGQGNARGDLTFAVPSKDLLGGLPPDRLPGFFEQALVVALATLLARQLEAGLVLTAPEALHGLAADLRGHYQPSEGNPAVADPPSGDQYSSR